ncbi:MAG: XisI protein [Roseofilum sp. Belize BBD 4]|nr:XisI protein [Roseofilum sp. Belize Diploria]MBP0035337.1 XisI protein [Roseofilum sp. Belize BBD 4]HBQ99374.1 XisI protein [Cyanobacteria bacterium UBA11691]
MHHCLVHAEIKQGKVWIHYDGIEDSVTEELVAAGILKTEIVLAFHPPYIREKTGYALA